MSRSSSETYMAAVCLRNSVFSIAEQVPRKQMNFQLLQSAKKLLPANRLYTLTANELYISQPAVSRAIRALEEELEIKLFYRDKRSGLILTDTGEKILLLTRQMADLENRMYQIAFQDRNFQGGKVQISSIPMLTSVILSKVIFRFRQEYPLVAVELREGSSAEIRKAAQEHRADFSFASSPFEDMDHLVLFIDQMVSVSRNQRDSQMPVSLDQNINQFVL